MMKSKGFGNLTEFSVKGLESWAAFFLRNFHGGVFRGLGIPVDDYTPEN